MRGATLASSWALENKALEICSRVLGSSVSVTGDSIAFSFLRTRRYGCPHGSQFNVPISSSYALALAALIGYCRAVMCSL